VNGATSASGISISRPRGSAAAPLITRRFGGEVEKFIGDGLVAVFNSRSDQLTMRFGLRAPHSRSRAGSPRRRSTIPIGHACVSA
jgi:class 3 adenylate cyclase